MTRSRHINRRHHRWTGRQDAALRREYPDSTAAAVAAHLGVTPAVVYRRAHRLGLEKSAEFKASELSGQIRRASQTPAMIAARFPKGHVPANKGLRRPGWAPGRMAETQFKKGRPAHESPNYLPIGSVRASKDGLLERKMTDDPKIVPARRWQFIHRLVWVKRRGKIPRGHVVRFKPGKSTSVLKEITIGRLECISFAENMRRNSLWNAYPKPIALLIQLRGQLNRRIRQKESRAQEHQ